MGELLGDLQDGGRWNSLQPGPALEKVESWREGVECDVEIVGNSHCDTSCTEDIAQLELLGPHSQWPHCYQLIPILSPLSGQGCRPPLPETK